VGLQSLNPGGSLRKEETCLLLLRPAADLFRPVIVGGVQSYNQALKRDRTQFAD